MQTTTHASVQLMRAACTAAVLGALVGLTGCGTLDNNTGQVSQPLNCDDGLKSAFKPDGNTSVVRVKAFRKGDPLKLENTVAAVAPATQVVAPADICLVKLLIGPGKAGPAGAPSTSAGIGIEVWLPPASTMDATQTAWNQIIRAYGSGGWAGGFHADATRLSSGATSNANVNFVAHMGAVAQGYAVSTSDHGHGRPGNGSFARSEDGSINTVLWQDFAERSMLEQAEKTKALAKLYYGKPQRYAYFDGFSTGGRQGYKLAQKYPRAYDGILAGAPAFNWSRFITAELYPQVAMQQELGAPIAAAKLNAVSAAANTACGGATLGFQLDPLSCRYDPTKDAAALCPGEVGNGVTGASARADTCVTAREAAVINKIWFGLTRDGSHADPAVDNAGSTASLSDKHLWFGLTRGTNLTSLAGNPPFSIASVQVALELQDATVAQASPPGTLTNAAGSNLGQDRWRSLGYADLARAFDQGLALQPAFSDINTDSADLTALRDRGAKVISYHGLADQLIMPQGSIRYFERLAATMGGVSAVQQFNRLYLIPGHAHAGTFASSASIDPATLGNASADKVPLPQPASGRDELFTALRNWVERGQAPGRIDVSSANASVTMPLCVYPQKAVLTGTSPTSAASYACR